jgi:hypothetical protein
VAKGDPGIVDASGFPSYSNVRMPDFSAPAAPANVRLRHGEVSDSIRMRYQPDRQKSMNEVQQCLAERGGELDARRPLRRQGKADLNGYLPGSTLWLRVRTCGLKGVMGASSTRRRSWRCDVAGARKGLFAPSAPPAAGIGCRSAALAPGL